MASDIFSRLRMFEKSLTLSTLEAIFSGWAELFKDLSAKDQVSEQAKNTFPVIRFDMSGLESYLNSAELNNSIIRSLEDIAEDNGLQMRIERTSGEMLHQIIRALYKKYGQVIVLIDEYDKPILDNINDLQRANEMRKVLRSFYLALKNCDKHLRFVILSEISKFSKVGVFWY